MSEPMTIRKIFPEKYFSKLRERERQKLKFILKKKFAKKARKKRAYKKQYKNKELIKKSKMNETEFDEISGNSINNVRDMNEWQLQHQIAYWKSRALSLESENKMLHEHIRNIYSEDWNKKTSNTFNMQCAPCNISDGHLQKANTQTISTNPETEIENETNLQDDSSYKFVVDDTWLKAMEQTERHHRQLRKDRDAERAKQKECRNSNRDNEMFNNTDKESDDHVNEINRLYGKGAAMIRACEAAVQCSFERHAKKNVPYWPHLPLKI